MCATYREALIGVNNRNTAVEAISFGGGCMTPKEVKEAKIGDYFCGDYDEVSEELAVWMNEMLVRGVKCFRVSDIGSNDMSIFAFSKEVSQEDVDRLNWDEEDEEDDGPEEDEDILDDFDDDVEEEDE